MRKRNLFIVLGAITLILLLLFSSQATTRSQSGATAAASEAATASAGAACEALRTVPQATPLAEAAAEGTEAAPAEVARPSNPGGPGAALKLTGDPQAGAKVYVDTCQKCHGDQGQGGVQNPGSDDGTIPSLNPIDETIADADAKVFACNIDLFVEHGSVPSGPRPQQTMQAWGDQHTITDQQIADVIAYVISLNASSSAATATPSASGS